METGIVSIMAIYIVEPDKLSLLESYITELATKTRQEKGNISYNVFTTNSDGNEFIFYEVYKDEAALSAHRNAPYFKEIIIDKIIPILKYRKVYELNPFPALLKDKNK